MENQSISGRIGFIRTNRSPRAHGNRPNDNRPSLDAIAMPLLARPLRNTLET
jgi:hypothetical protein